MNDLSIIDQFLQTFSTYIDSGFGLLHGEVAFLSATLIVIDMTLAGLFWAMSYAGGGGDDIMAKLIKKVLYVGAFAYIIGNFNLLAGIVFRSFAGLGLIASGSALSQAQFLQPGHLAKIGVDAGAPILQQIKDMAGFPDVFVNLVPIVVMFLAWAVLIVSFFILAIQLFITLIEFKLTTLAGFVLVPFALWNKTSFLAEKVLGNVVASGIKILILAVIVGIGSGLFSQFQTIPAEPSIDHALVVMLAALTMLGLGIFGPGIATGLVSGAPQLGAGAAAGTALGAAGLAIGAGAAVGMAGGAVAAGARMAPGGIRAMGSAASGARSAYQAGATASGNSGLKGAGAGLANVAKTGASAVGQKDAARFRSAAESTGAMETANPARAGPTAAQSTQPAWAKRLQRKQQVGHAATTAAHTLRGGDGGGGGASPSLRDPSND
jgi:type IV secretion system protein TrbL